MARHCCSSRPPPNSRRLSSRWSARPSTPSTATRGAANSIASGKPSSLRQISTTSGGVCHRSARSLFDDRGNALDEIAVRQGRPPTLRGPFSRDEGGGLLRGPEGDACTRPRPPSGSLLVARRTTPGAPRKRGRQARGRVDDMFAIVEQQTSVRLFLRPSTRPGQADPRLPMPRARARWQPRLGTNPRGPPRRRQIDHPGRRARNWRSCARRRQRATVVLPTPPGPTIVIRRWRDSRATSAATTSSRPISRVYRVAADCWHPPMRPSRATTPAMAPRGGPGETKL